MPTFIKAGYNFSMAGTSLPGAPATCNGLGARPICARVCGRGGPTRHCGQARFFGTNSDGVIYEDTASLGGTMPETGAPPSGHPIK